MVINDAASLDLVLVHPGGRSRVYQELGDRLTKVNLIGTMATFVDEAEAILTDSERPLQDVGPCCTRVGK